MDKFKEVNELYGHASGDRYLKMFVSIGQTLIRDADTIELLGGDEFSVLLPKAVYVDAKHLAQSILEQLNIPKRYWLGLKCRSLYWNGKLSW